MRILLLIFLLVLPLGVSAQEATATSSIAAEDAQATDAAMAQRLRGILGELEGYEDITVTVSSGIVTLRGTTLSAEDTARLESMAARLEGVVAVESNVTETGDVMRRLDPVRERLQERLTALATMAPLLGIALVVFALIVFLGFLLARHSFLGRLAPNAFIADIYRMVIRLAFMVIGIVVALDILNATALLSTILGAAGIIGLAVGFAVRDTVENFIASIMLSIRQPFRPNDAVEINGDQGLVIRLTSRATILLSFDGNHIRIPNATVFKSRIVNFSTNPERRFTFEIGVAADADLAAMRHLAEETVAALPFIIAEPAPSVWTSRIGDGAIILNVTGWIDQRETSLQQARSEAIRKVKAAIEAAGVEVPDTTYRISLTGMPVAGVETVATPPKQAPAGPIADDITDTTPDALARMTAEEQQDTDKPNLLRQDAAEE
ncbi:MAG: mechanosensitive ion channel [Rhodobacteraceae bacterium]|nr:mechanosensitive ion channel [Paracoccaceae bacterium]